MEKNHPINDMMATTIAKVRDLVDANTIIGEPIVSGNVTLIPVSRISVGFGTGGSEFRAKGGESARLPFGGGGGAGVKISPVAFISITGDQVKLLTMSSPAESPLDRVVDLVPDLLDKVTSFFEKTPKTKAVASDFPED